MQILSTISILLFLGSKNSSTIVFDDWLGLVGHWAEDITLKLLGGIPAYFYSKSRAFTQESLMSSSDVDRMFEFIDNADKGAPIWFVIFDLAGGAVNDVPSTLPLTVIGMSCSGSSPTRSTP